MVVYDRSILHAAQMPGFDGDLVDKLWGRLQKVL